MKINIAFGSYRWYYFIDYYGRNYTRRMERKSILHFSFGLLIVSARHSIANNIDVIRYQNPYNYESFVEYELFH